MMKHPGVGIIGPRIVFTKNPEQTAHNANFVGGWTGRYYSKNSYEPIVCDWLYSTCCLVRKEVLEETGGFYPGYYILHEEVDFCLRAKRAGFLVVYYPKATAQHEVDLSQPKRERLYYLYRNKILLIKRNFPFPRRFPALSLVIFLGLPKYLIESMRFHKKIVFSELRLIFLSVWHGFINREGRLKKNDNSIDR
jgi:GT2 family glycosyltransferase